MSVVVNLNELNTRFIQLGWTGINPSEVASRAANASIPGAQLIGYLDALLGSPGGCDDTAMTNCTAINAAKLTNAFKNLGLLIT